jgi:hypothetical protein
MQKHAYHMELAMTRLFSFVSCSIAITLLSACSTPPAARPRFPLYVGPLRPVEEVARFLPTSVVLTRIDGADVPAFKLTEYYGMAGRNIEMLPGMHKLEYEYFEYGQHRIVKTVTPAIKLVNVEAGHVYAAEVLLGERKRWDVNIVDVTERERAKLATNENALSTKEHGK